MHSLALPASSCPEAASEQRRGNKRSQGKQGSADTHPRTYASYMRTIFSLNVLRTELLATNIKSRKGKSRVEVDIRRKRKKTTPWFDLNEFSSALLCLCGLCARFSCPLFLFHLLRPFPLGLRSLHSTADVAFILLLPGIKLNFGCVHLLSCRARAAALSSLSSFPTCQSPHFIFWHMWIITAP